MRWSGSSSDRLRKLDFWMKMYGSLAPCLRKPCVVIWKAQASAYSQVTAKRAGVLC